MKAILKSIPPGFLDGLDQESQDAIRAIVGKPVDLVGHDDRGFPELEFGLHAIWIDPSYVEIVDF